MPPIFTWQGKQLYAIKPEEIALLCAEGDYTKVILADNTFFRVKKTLSATLTKLPTEIFIRIHRSYAVSINHIKTLDRQQLAVGEHFIPISKQYFNSIVEKLNILG
ncbi:LytR/AlgR family response regulator transcription factor [Flavihumibacter petaseus]|uniref:Putative DNA-binding protein n=1 Tax=Flavihumibacter petaseus NBRC 106054 TaxID=1220578 RepID=A0A0E9N3Q0_9BACT|nr:LytTR family DNA-binding domain-containing protein [Flavihumibacter petaseus]GAO43985.1 putative DNA-binding protein [Flavihumibacter petaseus NBRC 106054]